MFCQFYYISHVCQTKLSYSVKFVLCLHDINALAEKKNLMSTFFFQSSLPQLKFHEKV